MVLLAGHRSASGTFFCHFTGAWLDLEGEKIANALDHHASDAKWCDHWSYQPDFDPFFGALGLKRPEQE